MTAVTKQNYQAFMKDIVSSAIREMEVGTSQKSIGISYAFLLRQKDAEENGNIPPEVWTSQKEDIDALHNKIIEVWGISGLNKIKKIGWDLARPGWDNSTPKTSRMNQYGIDEEKLGDDFYE